MLKKFIADKSLHASGVISFYRANSVGDDIEVYDDKENKIGTLLGLRQQVWVLFTFTPIQSSPG